MMSLLSSAPLLTGKRLQIHTQFTHLNAISQHHHQSSEVRTKTLEMENQTEMKPRILCLHGFRTSAAILKKQVGRWPETALGKLDLVFVDGPYPARGRSDVERFYDPPYYEWYQINQDFTEYYNFEECLAYLENFMINHGPFDGLLGFSQGAFLSAALPGMQSKGVALTKVPRIKFVVIISGSKFVGFDFGLPKLAANYAFLSPVKCPSLHIIDGEGLETMLSFIDKIQKMTLHDE
ncbi:rhodanese-like domain-containing protein 6 isoform X2 [Cornus florida]|uniref:rhodanese-like domain-containing protein 6 isoform X2 n=1 Tax=Cornus florida TaxID=4283 RepID=UPI0028982DD3|nr:rhodanese-like domain-containing protein 6 isoform X2 [Cornus florida]